MADQPQDSYASAIVRIKAFPANALHVRSGDYHLFIAQPGAWGMVGLGSLSVLNSPIEGPRDRDANYVLDNLKADRWETSKIRDHIASLPSLSVRTSLHDTNHVYKALRHHLRSHHLMAILVKNHDSYAVPPAALRGPSIARQMSLPAPVRPASTATPSPAVSAPITHAPANIAGWSASQRVEALLTATLPLLGKKLSAHLKALMTPETVRDLTVGLTVMAGLQAIPGVGEAVDISILGIGLAYAGWCGLQAIVHLARAVTSAVQADSEAEIAKAAPGAADAIDALTGAFLDVLVLRMGKRNTSGGGTAGGSAAPEQEALPPVTVNTTRGQGVGARTGSSTEVATEDPDAAAVAEDGTGTAAGGRAGESTNTADQVGHPVNPATGEVFTEQSDFTLPGPLPLLFRRLWISSSTLVGELGHGWHHTLDMALLPRPGGRHALRLADGRFVLFRTPAPGKTTHDAVERMQLSWQGGALVAIDYAGLHYDFGPAIGARQLRHLTAITDPNGNAIRLARNPDGALAAIRDSAGRDLAVRRDLRGRIVAIDAPHPDRDGLLTLAAFDYDASGDLVASHDAAGGSFRYTYERHLLVEEQRPAGLIFRFRYDDTARRTRARCVATWGDGGLYERHLAYDDAARTTIVRSGRGAVERFEYNEQGRVTARTDPLGRRTLRTYAPDGQLLLAETRADGATRSRTHDRFGRITTTTDFDGARRSVRFPDPDPQGRISALPLEITSPSGTTERFVWDDRLNLSVHTDAAGRERRFLRDTSGLTLAVKDALGVLRRFGWTERGELAWESAGDGERRIDFAYDLLGRLTQRRPAGQAPTLYRSDPAGRLAQIRRPDGGVIRLTHDAEGRVTSHHAATGAVTRWVYDGLPFPRQRIDADNSSLAYHYDADLNLTGLTNQKGEPYALSYDLADQLIEEIGFDGRRRTYAYDAAGHLCAHTDAESRGATYKRDGLGRLLERAHSDGLTDRYAYAPGGALTLAANDWGDIAFAYAPDGALLEETSPAGTLRHAYDARGRRTATTLPDGRTIETGWDTSDNVTSVSFDGRLVAAFTRDAMGRETERRAGALTTHSTYDPQGRLTRQRADTDSLQPVIDRQYRWDVADRLVETLDLARGVRRYQYDARARLVGVEGDLPERFVIDPAGNILGATSDDGAGSPGLATGDRLLLRGDRKFEYDGCGNRIREVRGAGGKVERLYRYRADNQLAEVEERSRRGRRMTSFAYDALGRRTKKRSCSWGPEAANDGAPNEEAALDVLTAFVWDGDVLLAEGRVEDPLVVVYLHEPGGFRPLAQVRRRSPDEVSSVRHYQNDHLGTPAELVNDHGQVLWRNRTRAWGGSVRAVEHDEEWQPIRFQGQYCDAETGLHYNRFRFYAPDEGCYLQQDPIGLLGGINPAAYGSNPALEVDPYGLAGEPATATHITYIGIDGATGRPYVGYASMQGNQNPLDVLSYRYSGNFSRFGGSAPQVIYSGYGQQGKDTARGLEQNEFERLGGLNGTANKQNPVGPNNRRAATYAKAASDYQQQKAESSMNDCGFGN